MGEKIDALHSIWIRKKDAEIAINPTKPYSWRYLRVHGSGYSQLFDLLEFLYLVPADPRTKEGILRALYESSLSQGSAPNDLGLPDIKISAMATPLFFDGEFQGIVYVAREFGERGFDKTDVAMFHRSVQASDLAGIMAKSKLALASISLREDEVDIFSPSLRRILDRLHIFSSAIGGLILMREKNRSLRAFERKGVSRGHLFESATRELPDADRIGKVIRTFGLETPDTKRVIRLFKGDKNFEYFEKLVNNTGSVSSILLMGFPNDFGNFDYVLLYFSEDLELQERLSDDWFKTKRKIRDVLRLRSGKCQFNIEELFDSDAQHKQLLSIERQKSDMVVNELPLMTLHYAKNLFRPFLVTRLEEALRLTDIGEIKNLATSARNFAEQFLLQASRFSEVWRDIALNTRTTGEKRLQVVSVLTPIGFIELCREISQLEQYKNLDIQIGQDCAEQITIAVPLEALRFVLEELLTNVTKTQAGEGKKASCRIQWNELRRPGFGADRVKISVWNSGPRISGQVLESAGRGPTEKVSYGNTGLGLYLVNLALSLLRAEEVGERRFSIVNTERPEGVEIAFTFIARERNGANE